MSLLRFIRKDWDDRKVAAVATPPSAPAAPVVDRTETLVAAPTGSPSAHNSALDLDRIRRELEEIARIIGAEDSAAGVSAANDIMVDIKLADIIQLAPQAFKNVDSLRSAAETTISVAVPRLFEQLAKGKATTKLSHLLVDIPADYLTPFAEEHGNDSINLPLHLVVASVQPNELRKRTSATEKDLGEKNLPNLFGPSIPTSAPSVPVARAVAPAPAPVAIPEVKKVIEPEPAPEPVVAAAAPVVQQPVVEEPVPAPELVAQAPVVPAEPEPVASVQPEPVVAPVPEEVIASLPAEQSATEFVTKVVEADTPYAEPVDEPEEESVSAVAAEEDSASRLVLAGLDLDSATAEEMTQRWNGVGLKLACKIVEVRQTQGPFADLYELARVPGLRGKRFELLTGLSWNATYFRYRDVVKQLIGTPDGEVPDIRQVTARFSELTGFVGCMVIHEDGLELAGSWNHASADALGAFAPQMFKKINKYVRPLKLGEMKALCFFVGHQPITVVHSGRIYFVALHQPDSLSKKQVSIAQALTMELGRRFSR